jgi:hypothetical protein
MASADDEIDKAVNIIIATKGTEEATKEVETMHDKSHKGQEQLQRDSTKSAEATDLFTRKWKNELLMIGGALGVLYGLTKYSPVAASMLDLLGVSLGYLATVILIPLLPYVLLLSDYIFKAADAFDKLPAPIKEATALLLGAYGLFKLLKGLGVIDLAVKVATAGLDALKWIWGLVGKPITQVVNFVAKEAAGGIDWLLDKWEKEMAAGGLRGAAAFLAAAAVGFVAGSLVVDLMDALGITKAIAKFGADVQAKFPALWDALKVALAPMNVINDVARDIWNGDFSKIPDHIQATLDKVDAILTKWKIPKSFSDAWSTLSLISNPLGALNTAATGTGRVAAAAATGDASTLKVSANSTDSSTGITRNAATGTKTYASGVSVPYNPATDTDLTSGVATTAASANSTATTAATVAATSATASANTAVGVFDTIANIAKNFIPQIGSLKTVVDAVANATNTTAAAVPQYAAGGYVASDQIAQLHKGDWIRSKYGDTTRDSTGKTDKGSTGTVINGGITINTQSKNPEEIFRYVNQRLQQKAGSRV